ncbi:MAG: helix-turn-helix transcriptional regulator [Nitrospirae bacterium]|nr:MAG: helix-turn-helix transcriptional regulator [Nitrospirota bacterium]
MTARRTPKAKQTAEVKAVRRVVPRLTARERQVLNLVANGYTSREIGEKLGISPRTAETHRVNIGRRLGIRNVAQMVRYAIENDLSPVTKRSR